MKFSWIGCDDLDLKCHPENINYFSRSERNQKTKKWPSKPALHSDTQQSKLIINSINTTVKIFKSFKKSQFQTWKFRVLIDFYPYLWIEIWISYHCALVGHTSFNSKAFHMHDWTFFPWINPPQNLEISAEISHSNGSKCPLLCHFNRDLTLILISFFQDLVQKVSV